MAAVTIEASIPGAAAVSSALSGIESRLKEVARTTSLTGGATAELGARQNALREIYEAANKTDTFRVSSLEQVTNKQNALTDAHKASTPHTRDAGRATLELSRGMEDLQYGVSGVLNNIPGLVQTLGGGAGLAGVISLAAVGLAQLVKHLDLAGPSLDEVADKAGEAAHKAGEHALATGEEAEAQAKAKGTTDALRASMEASNEAEQAQITSLKEAAAATTDLESRKKALLLAEQNLAILKVDAGEGSEVEKIRAKHLIKADFSAAAQRLEEEAILRAQATAAAEAKIHEEGARRQQQLASEALAARAALEANQAKGDHGNVRVGRAENQLAGVLGEIGTIINLDEDGLPGDRLLKGINIKEGDGGKSSYELDGKKGEADDLALAEKLRDNLVKFNEWVKDPLNYAQSGTEINYVKGERYQQRLDHLEGIIREILQGRADIKDAKQAEPELKGTAEGYGDPAEAARAAAAEQAKAAQLREKARAESGRLADSGKLYEVNREASDVEDDTAARKAEEAAHKAAEREEQRAAQKQRADEAKKQRELTSQRGEDVGVGGAAAKLAADLPNPQFASQLKQAALKLEGGDHAALAQVMNLCRDIIGRVERGQHTSEAVARDVQDLQRRLSHTRTGEN